VTQPRPDVARPPAPNPIGVPRVAVVLAALAALAAVVLASGVWAQLTRPFIRRDDWPFLLPPDTPGAADPLRKVQEEGRWLSYAWWQLVGQHGTPVTGVVVLFVAYVLFVVGLWRLFRVPGLVGGGVLAAALLVSPLWVRLIYWPGTLTASAVVAAAGVWTLPWAARRRGALVAWALVASVAAVLSYPPVGGLLLVAAGVHLRWRAWRDVVLVVVAFLTGFAVGTVTIFVLNGIAFGEPGVTIAQWRRPNPVDELRDLPVNARRQLRQHVVLVRTLSWATVVGVVAWGVALVDATVRPAALKVALTVAVVAGLECLQALVTGVSTNVRGSLWAWLALVVPAGLLLTGPRLSRVLGAAALCALTVFGLLAWRWDLGTHQDTGRSYDAIVAAALRTRGDDAAREVVFRQDPAERRTARGRITEGTLRMMFYERAGVVVRWCRADECRSLDELAGKGPVHDLGTVTGVIVPSPPAVL
jgi:hypothetical protein